MDMTRNARPGARLHRARIGRQGQSGPDSMPVEQVRQTLREAGDTPVTKVKADDGHRNGAALKNGVSTELHIDPRIARRGTESSEHLGRCRWIVGRILAWPARSRRPAIRHARRADRHLAFTTLACALKGRPAGEEDRCEPFLPRG